MASAHGSVFPELEEDHASRWSWYWEINHNGGEETHRDIWEIGAGLQVELCIQEIHYQGEHERTLTDGKMEIRFIVGSDSLLIICNTKLTVHFSTHTDIEIPLLVSQDNIFLHTSICYHEWRYQLIRVMSPEHTHQNILWLITETENNNICWFCFSLQPPVVFSQLSKPTWIELIRSELIWPNVRTIELPQYTIPFTVFNKRETHQDRRMKQTKTREIL